ncbi:hypothetical protein METBIDRAFT_13935 [Metschnikowia bicuspidata var. bicuspidata NRRL YB-4993]|uniref:Uncharacterized protein n=1 Tax=Metschnikowia bicuspidata var. bicuspidata NRRL YB-4993 TaxID=869754 RepID=A0A1A0H275_9ASCO|nr:hypothetical protein METBIDRAFT_13935 [Metschnikowia bicuspidata var. bicuspidata NRRL YB-4993]OBA18027.1 hypothetical protein METBIDRAFT_13935 [Metschnikowia bicuspidata var. bicuspidata NRRL YB-4993]
MVVRAAISTAVNLVPFSDRLPQRVHNLMGSGASRLADLELSPDEVRPLATPSQKIRKKMREKRPATERSSLALGRNSSLDAEDDGNDTARDTDTQSLRTERVELYLCEQHDEFTSLINRNLKEVVRQQQQRQAEEAGWRRLVLEIMMARAGDDATQKLVLLVARAQDSIYASVPFIHSERRLQTSAGEYGSSALKVDSAELLDQLDYAQKVALLRHLMVDLGMRADADDIAEFTRGSLLDDDTSIADKLELLVLLLVRLWFIGLRCLVPVLQHIYTRFKENDMLLVNNRNFSRLLTVLARAMVTVEERLNTFSTGLSRLNSQASSRPSSQTLATSAS